MILYSVKLFREKFCNFFQLVKVCLSEKSTYPIGQKNVGLIFRRTKLFVGQNFRHLQKISSLLFDERFCQNLNRFKFRIENGKTWIKTSIIISTVKNAQYMYEKNL